MELIFFAGELFDDAKSRGGKTAYRQATGKIGKGIAFGRSASSVEEFIEGGCWR